MTLDQISSFRTGTTLLHVSLKNADGSPLRARVNGKIQGSLEKGTWRLPMKYGLKSCFYITQANLQEWQTC